MGHKPYEPFCDGECAGQYDLRRGSVKCTCLERPFTAKDLLTTVSTDCSKAVEYEVFGEEAKGFGEVCQPVADRDLPKDIDLHDLMIIDAYNSLARMLCCQRLDGRDRRKVVTARLKLFRMACEKSPNKEFAREAAERCRDLLVQAKARDKEMLARGDTVGYELG